MYCLISVFLNDNPYNKLNAKWNQRCYNDGYNFKERQQLQIIFLQTTKNSRRILDILMLDGHLYINFNDSLSFDKEWPSWKLERK